MNQEQMRAVDAQQLLDNPVFKGAVEHMEAYLETQALSTDPDDKGKCARIVISKQLLRGLIREINKYIETGEVVTLRELHKKTVAQKVFRR